MITTQGTDRIVAGSFRDPSGFVFWRRGELFRQINHCSSTSYERLMTSGLYVHLVDEGLLIPHSEVEEQPLKAGPAYKVIQPEKIPFISYPYEWCFSQLRDAALVTLRIQQAALEHGMWLKDASAYNIQFFDGHPVLIDTLSLESCHEGQPWPAYGQFCRHFLAPLALASYKDIRLAQLARVHIDGIPIDLASHLLPRRTWFRFGLLVHLHLHARSQRFFENRQIRKTTRTVSRTGVLGILSNLRTTIGLLHWRPDVSTWEKYYEESTYSSETFAEKNRVIEEMVDLSDSDSVWDLGANTGVFSRICSKRGIQTVAFDSDANAVEHNYLKCRRDADSQILPLIMDLTNPSSGIGWQGLERMSLADRGPVDTALALALVHHLAIGNNLPLKEIAEFFRSICNTLIVEFVPKTDSQVKRMLITREDVFTDYCQKSFENAFSPHFETKKTITLPDSRRTVYLMQQRSKTPQKTCKDE